MNTFQLTTLLLYIFIDFCFAQEITNFGNINTISIFTILHYSTRKQQIKLVNFFNTINFIMITVNISGLMQVSSPTKVLRILLTS